jgi:3-oxoacyl-[acyl-carrier protein] reductase
MELGLRGRVALVTGGSKGIGRAIAIELGAEGCRVAICARGRPELDQVKALLAADGVQCIAACADVTRAEEVKDFVAQVGREFGRLDILVNNAGGAMPGRFAQLGDEEMIRDYEVKILSQIRFVRAALALLEKSEAPRVININAIAGRVAVPHLFATTTHRAACLALTKALALELADRGILVNSVNIGSVITPQWTRIRDHVAPDQPMERFTNELSKTIALGRFGRPEEVSGLVAFLASDRASYITGASIDVGGGAGMHV